MLLSTGQSYRPPMGNGLADVAIATPQMILAFWNAYPATYSGYCLRIQRVSDNATQDIGFDGNGIVDVAAIASFCGASNGRIFFWYDQLTGEDGGGGTTVAARPVIYDGSTGEMIVDANGVISWNLIGLYALDLRKCAVSSNFVIAMGMTINDTVMMILGDGLDGDIYMGAGQNGSSSTTCYNDNLASSGVGGPYYKDGVIQSGITNRNTLHDTYSVNTPIRVMAEAPRTTLGMPTPAVYLSVDDSFSIVNGKLTGYIAQWTVSIDEDAAAAFDDYVVERMAAVAAAL